MSRQRIGENIESDCSDSEGEEIEGEALPQRKERTRSKIWDYFKKSDEDQEYAFCNICGKKVKRKQGSTTGLWCHLQKDHENVHADLIQNKPTEKRALTFYNRNSPEWKKITKAIAEMIVLDMEPYSLVEHKGFRNLMKIVALRYQIPHRTTFSRNIIPSMYEEEKQKLACKILQDLSEGTSFG